MIGIRTCLRCNIGAYRSGTVLESNQFPQSSLLIFKRTCLLYAFPDSCQFLLWIKRRTPGVRLWFLIPIWYCFNHGNFIWSIFIRPCGWSGQALSGLITVLEDKEYMVTLREKMNNIKKVAKFYNYDLLLAKK